MSVNTNWNGVQSGKNPLIDLMTKYPDKKWYWDYISQNPNITWEIIEANPDKPWNWECISMNPNITMDIIDKCFFNGAKIFRQWRSICQHSL